MRLVAKVAHLLERSRAEAALRRSAEELRKQQEFLRCVIDNSPNMIYVKDRAGRFTLANHAAAAVFGTTVAALLGQREADFLPQAEDAARHERDDRAILATMDEQFIIEERLVDVAERCLRSGAIRTHRRSSSER